MIVYSTPGLRGLELWHAISGRCTLDQLRHSKREYFGGLRDFLVRLHRGEAVVADDVDARALHQAAGFHTVIVCGGEALDPLLAQALDAATLPFRVEIDDSGPYAGARGASRIFEEMQWSRGVALDLGQTQLKVIDARGALCLPRDTESLPFGANSIAAATGRELIRSMIQHGLALASERSPDGIVLALPVALSPEGAARPATYPGLSGPVEPIFDGLFQCPWVVLNDAVLTARGFPPAKPGKTLVVTLGFGIGGALWET